MEKPIKTELNVISVSNKFKSDSVDPDKDDDKG